MVIVLLAGLGIWGLAQFAPRLVQSLRGMMQAVVEESKPFQLAMERVRADGHLRELLGEPIRAGEFSSWHYHRGEEAHEASFRIPLHGPKGTAELSGKAEWRGGEWQFQELRATLADGTSVDVQ